MPYDFDHVIERRGTGSSKWHKYGPDVLPLWVADMDFASPEPVIQALRDRVEHGLFGYGHESAAFNDIFVDRLYKRYGWQVSPEALVIVPGVVAAFNLACRSVAAPGDGILLQTPVYPPMLRVAGNLQAQMHAMTLTQQQDGQYGIDFDAFEAAISERTRVFLLCNPHNPVGRVFTHQELCHMAEICERHDLFICADELHCDLTFSGHQHVPIATLSPEIASRTITLMAPSKTFNLAGLKCAVAIIPDADLRERFRAMRVDLVPNMVNIMGYTAAMAAYRDGQPWLDALLRYLESNRNHLTAYVQTHLPGVSMAPPEGTYLAWLDCRQAAMPHHDPQTFFLDRAHVALNDGKTFGKGGEGFVRLNFGTPQALLQQALEQMHTALTNVREPGRG